MKKRFSAKRKLSVLGVCVTLLVTNVYANNYYFSSSQGDDSRSSLQAQNAATPWKTIEKLNSVFNQFNSGDSILFLSGEVFYGSIVVNKSGTSGTPFIFSSYGTGSKPVITGFAMPASWTNMGSNIWETPFPSSLQRMNTVLVNGVSTPAGRYPNADADNKGYLNIRSAQGYTSFTMAYTGNNPNWTGGEVVIRKNRWVIDRNFITQHQGNTITYASQSDYVASAGYGYFIQNHPGTLDRNGEWYYQNSNKKFGIYSSTGLPSPGSVSVSNVSNLVSINSQSNIQFYNLQFTGANENAFFMDHASSITIQNCEMLNNYNSINAGGSDNLTVVNCTIQNSGNNACRMEGCNNVTVKNNRIRNTGVFVGMGDGNTGSYEALLLNGSNQLVEGNTIDSTGYIGITFRGSNVVVKNNVVNFFSFIKDDGSGIYTWNNVSNPPTYTGEVIANNIVLNGIGAGEGTTDPQNRYANGVYMDDNAGGVEISGNTIANCSNYGVYVHNAHDLSIVNNIVYNNTVQLEMTHDDPLPYLIRNVTLTGNQFVAKQVKQGVAEFKTTGDDIGQYGNFDNNYYSRPFFDDLQIGVLTKVNGTYKWNAYNVEGWKTAYGKDLHSKGSPLSYKQFSVNNFTGSNLYPDGGFLTSLLNVWVESDAGNAGLSIVNNVLDGNALQLAFSSNTGNSNAMVLMRTGGVQANHQYVLKFSLKGTVANKTMGVYLRQGNGSYGDLVDRQYLSVTADRTEQQFLFTPSATSSSPHLAFIISDAAQKVYIDNIQLVEADVTSANPDDSLKFAYNTISTSQATPLNGNYTDIVGNNYNSGITLLPYTSSVLLKKSSTQGGGDEPVACSATGSILCERWYNASGNTVGNIPLQTTPTNSSQLTIFETPSNAADNYGTRIRGYICPPQTGNYTFWIAGDDATELWLSTDSTMTNKSKIAYNLSWTSSRQWDKFATQKSASVYLVAGHKYYVEALHKEGEGGDNLAVAWQLPNGTFEGPIAGARLSPFVSNQVGQIISFPAIGDRTYGDAPFTLLATASSGLPVGFSVLSGPATLNGNTITITGFGVVTIQAIQSGNSVYTPASTVTQAFTVNNAVPTCTATGTILREQWNNISGHAISSIPLQTTPASTSSLTIFESPTNVAENFGARIRGYICPPQSGNYTFWIAADDVAELWLSKDDNSSNKTMIANVPSWTKSREWTKYPSQKSASIYLEAGHKYYIEALHKEGDGGDNLAVAWQLPSGTIEAPIPGSRLSPASNVIDVPSPPCSGTGTIVREQWNNISGNNINSVPTQTTANSTSKLSSFEAPLNVADNFGARIRGYICVPITGNYTFWIAADDQAQLWLSTTQNESDKVLIANVPYWTNSREWTKYASQKSISIYLIAGQKYYIEALHKEGNGSDNLAVAWQLPDNTVEAPIPGLRLIPYSTADVNVASLLEEKTTQTALKLDMESIEKDKAIISVYPNPVSSSATIEVNLKEIQGVALQLINEQGLVVKNISGKMNGNYQKFTLLRNGLSSGMYIIRLITSSGVINKKVIVTGTL